MCATILSPAKRRLCTAATGKSSRRCSNRLAAKRIGSDILIKTTRSAAAKRIAVFLTLCLALLFFLSGDISAESARRNYLKTTYCTDSYAVFEISGNTVKAQGVYRRDRLRRIESSRGDMLSMKFSCDKDGNFEAEFELESLKGESDIIFRFESGAAISYVIRCDGAGWYFPDNGLSEKNRLIFDSILDIPASAVPSYYTASGDPGRAAEIQEQIRAISDTVTQGIEDDYEKARALSAYVASNIYYDLDAKIESVSEATVSLENIIADKRTVCIGFASFYCALLEAQGIDCVSVVGSAVGDDVTYDTLGSGKKNHHFCAFWYEKGRRWVWADPCWCGSGNYQGGEYFSRLPHEKFFDISDDALAIYHRADYAFRVNYMADMNGTGEPAPTEEAPAETTTAEAQVTSPTETSPPETTAAENFTLTEAAPDREEALPAEDNSPLIIAAIVLAAAVIGLIVYIIVTVKRYRS